MFKPWILYVVITWLATPVGPENQKTIILQFDGKKDCMSIVKQVKDQINNELIVPFKFKTLVCVPCTDLYGARCSVNKGKR